MRFPYTKAAPPQKKRIDVILDDIREGKCDDLEISEFKSFAYEIYDNSEFDRISRILLNNIESSNNVDVLTYSIKAIPCLLPLTPAMEESIIRQTISILKIPFNSKHKVLHEAISNLLLVFLSTNVDYARLMMPELLTCMDDRNGPIGTNAFSSLMIVAIKKPEHFEQHSGTLIKLLGSINKSTRAETAKIISIIAKTHPEYVSRSLPMLEYLSIFYPDPHVKKSAAEAYQMLSARLKAEEEKHAGESVIQRERAAAEKRPSSTGFADILRRNVSSGSPGNNNEADVKYGISPGTAQRQCIGPEDSKIDASSEMMEAQLKELMEKVKDDFAINADSLLDSMGMSHLTRKKPRVLIAPEDIDGRYDSQEAGEEVQGTAVSGILASEEDNDFMAGIEGVLAQASMPITFTAGPADMADTDQKAQEEIPDRMQDNSEADCHKANEPGAEEAAVQAHDNGLRENAIKKQDTSTILLSRSIFPSMRMKPAATEDHNDNVSGHVQPYHQKPEIKPLGMAETRAESKSNVTAVPESPESSDADNAGTEETTVVQQHTDGEKVEYMQECPVCYTKLPVDSQYCISCGSRVKSRQRSGCPGCGRMNVHNARFCAYCGSKIKTSGTVDEVIKGHYSLD